MWFVAPFWISVMLCSSQMLPFASQRTLLLDFLLDFFTPNNERKSSYTKESSPVQCSRSTVPWSHLMGAVHENGFVSKWFVQTYLSSISVLCLCIVCIMSSVVSWCIAIGSLYGIFYPWLPMQNYLWLPKSIRLNVGKYIIHWSHEIMTSPESWSFVVVVVVVINCVDHSRDNWVYP